MELTSSHTIVGHFGGCVEHTVVSSHTVVGHFGGLGHFFDVATFFSLAVTTPVIIGGTTDISARLLDVPVACCITVHGVVVMDGRLVEPTPPVLHVPVQREHVPVVRPV